MTWDLFLENLPLAIVAAVIIGLVVCGVIIVRYKKGNHSATYPLTEFTNLELTGRSDLYIGKTIRRVRIKTDRKN